MPIRLFVVAGEDSGDAHAAALIEALRAREGAANVVVAGLGGPRMEAAGCAILHDLVTRSVMGYIGVFKRLPEFARIMREAVDAVEKLRPDCVIGVDYPGFNLRLAARVKQRGFRYCQYISPQVWAWRRRRVKAIARHVDRMLAILPFEEAFYGRYGVPVTYVGHPLVDELRDVRGAATVLARGGLGEEEPVLALLPGSRPAEVKRGLPVMAAAARALCDADPSLRVAVPAAKPALRRLIADGCAAAGLPAVVVDGHAPQVLKRARGAIVTSGTATLQAAVVGTPMAILYKIAPWQAPLPPLLIRSKFIGMPNLIAGSRVVPEFLQSIANPRAIVDALQPLLRDTPERTECLAALGRVRDAFGEPGAADRAAAAVLETIRSAPAPSLPEAPAPLG
ncbi:MAG: lipid-A-disaccharide synthase [Planctomycetota bacterium]